MAKRIRDSLRLGLLGHTVNVFDEVLLVPVLEPFLKLLTGLLGGELDKEGPLWLAVLVGPKVVHPPLRTLFDELVSGGHGHVHRMSRRNVERGQLLGGTSCQALARHCAHLLEFAHLLSSVLSSAGSQVAGALVHHAARFVVNLDVFRVDGVVVGSVLGSHVAPDVKPIVELPLIEVLGALPLVEALLIGVPGLVSGALEQLLCLVGLHDGLEQLGEAARDGDAK